MMFAAILRQSTRIVVFAAMTAAATFGGIALVHELAAPAAPASPSNAATLNAKIAASLAALAADRTSADALALLPQAAAPTGDAELAAQIAAATDRHDLALRHAQGIRAGMSAGNITSLAEVRDSVVIGQLLSQQTALDLQIAEQGAKFKASHPVMRALQAHRTALSQQISDEAAATATALEAEAKLDAAQVAALQAQRDAEAATATTSKVSAPAAQASTGQQRAELDQLLLTYLTLPASQRSAATTTTLLSPLNLMIVAAAALAALVWQINAAIRHRRFRASDLEKWTTDRDTDGNSVPAVEIPADSATGTETARRAA